MGPLTFFVTFFMFINKRVMLSRFDESYTKFLYAASFLPAPCSHIVFIGCLLLCEIVRRDGVVAVCVASDHLR